MALLTRLLPQALRFAKAFRKRQAVASDKESLPRPMLRCNGGPQPDDQ
jgi:hypothetical protein